MKNKPTVLVTGGAGYIGSHVVLALRDQDFPVVVIDDLSTGKRGLVADDVPFVVGDVGDQQLVSRIFNEYQCGAVMHFAGSIIVPESVAQPLKYYANNTSNSRNLIECCLEAGVNAFVFSSTAAVYGNPDQLPVSESAPKRPLNPYGASKLMTEQMLEDVSRVTEFRYAALRYFNVAGADPQGRSGQAGPNSTHLIRVACELAAGTRREMAVYGDDYATPDGTCVRDYIHVSDLADVHLLALQHLIVNRQSMTVNCGYGHGHSVREVVSAVRALCDRPLTVHTAKRREGDAATLVADVAKIHELLAWKPNHDDLREIIETALAWESAIAENPIGG